ncbi:hypothetical protein BH11ARM1_BH11ARM1_00650 [soil metagenome]
MIEFSSPVRKPSPMIVLSTFLAAVLPMVSLAVLASRLGANEHSDLFIVLFSVGTTLLGVVTSGAAASAFNPVFSELMHAGQTAQAWKLYRSAVTLATLVFIPLTFLCWGGALAIAMLIAPGMQLSIKLNGMEANYYVLGLLVFAQWCVLVGGFSFGALYAKQVFTLPALPKNLANLGLIIGGLFIGTPISMVAGFAIGAFLANMVFPIYPLYKSGLSFAPSFDFKILGSVLRRAASLASSFGLAAGFYFALQYTLSSAPSGTVTCFFFAWSLVMAPVTVIGGGLALGASAGFSQFFSSREEKLLKRQVDGTVRTAVFLTLPVTAALLVMAKPLVGAFLHRGSFDEASVLRTAEMVRWFAVTIPAWSVYLVMVRMLLVIERSRFLMVQNAIYFVVFAVICLGMRSSMSLALNCFFMLGSFSVLVLQRFAFGTSRFDAKAFWITFGKSAVASLGAAAICAAFALTPLVDYAGPFLLLGCGLTAILAGWAYYFAAKALEVPEADLVGRSMIRVQSQPK